MRRRVDRRLRERDPEWLGVALVVVMALVIVGMFLLIGGEISFRRQG